MRGEIGLTSKYRNIMVTYFSWWYGQAVDSFWRAIIIMTRKVYSFFSIRILFVTIFDPWKRDAYGVENASLETRFKIFVANMLSRVIGFVIRLFTIIMGLASVALFFLLLVSILVIWLFLPIVVLGLIVNGARIMING